MTAYYCYRAIEIIRKFYFEDFNVKNEDKRKKQGWQKLKKELEFPENCFNEIKQFSDANRHGEYPLITYEQRERIMNLTRKIIDKTIDKLLTSIIQ